MGERKRAFRRLRLLVLNEFFYPDNQGGTGSAMADLVSRLARDYRFEVEVITSPYSYRERDAKYSAREDWNGIKINRVRGPNWGRASASKRFLGNLIFTASASVRALSMKRPDVVLVTTAPVPLPMTAKLLMRLKRVPYAYLIYDLEPNRTVALQVMADASRPVAILRGWQRKWLKGADVVIAIGRCMRDYIVSRYDLDLRKVVVIEVGADAEKVTPILGQTRFQKSHGLSGFVVLYSGNYGQYHDFDTILGAAEQLKGRGKEVTFVIVGNGHRRRHLEDMIASRFLTNVRLFDFVPEEDYPDLLASGDIHVVTLARGMEGLCVPSKLYTSLAAGRRVVTVMPEDAEAARTVVQGECGVNVAPGDVNGLVNEVERCLADPDLVRESGEQARKVLERQYSTARVAEKFASVLQQAAGAVQWLEGPIQRNRSELCPDVANE